MEAPHPTSRPTSHAISALVLAVFGLFCCGLCAPIAWYLGNHELRAIDAGIAAPEGRSNASLARTIGIVGTILWFVVGVLGGGSLLFFLWYESVKGH